MGKHSKLRERIIQGASAANIHFADLRSMLEHFGFSVRVSGSHHIFTRADVEEIIDLQSAAGGKAKPYQVRQVCGILLKYKIE